MTLTVTDDDGATNAVTKPVMVTAAPQLARDTFSRTFTNGFGTADVVGGGWTVTSAASLSVNGSAGVFTMPAGNGPSAYLNAVSAANVDAVVETSSNKSPTGGSIFHSLVTRRIGTSDYRLKVQITATAVAVYLVRTVNGAETTLASQTIPGLVYQANQVLHLRLRTTGTGTTTLQGKLWVDGQTEPTAWNVTATDTTAALQNPGAVGLYTFLSGAATNAPIAVQVDDFEVVSA